MAKVTRFFREPDKLSTPWLASGSNHRGNTPIWISEFFSGSRKERKIQQKKCHWESGLFSSPLDRAKRPTWSRQSRWYKRHRVCFIKKVLIIYASFQQESFVLIYSLYDKGSFTVSHSQVPTSISKVWWQTSVYKFCYSRIFQSEVNYSARFAKTA